MATSNILSIHNAGLVAYDGSATFNGRTLTAGSSKISITNGSGVSGNPTVDAVEANFTLNNIGGTLSVSKGGTGATTLTSHSLLLGHGTSAVTGLGAATNGQLPIGSTGNDPVLATLTAGSGITITNGAGSIQIDGVGGSASAGSVLDYFDDFIYPNISGGSTPSILGNLRYYNSASKMVQIGTAGRPGVINAILGFSGGGTGGITIAQNEDNVDTDGPIVLGSGTITIQWYVKLQDLSDGTNTYTCRIGLGNPELTTAPTNGCWFEYTNAVNSGNWQIKTANGSTNTVNTSSAADTNWHIFKIIVNAAASSVSFYIDGTQVSNSPVSSNIPTSTPVGPMFTAVKTAGASTKTVLIDLMTFNYILTTPR